MKGCKARRNRTGCTRQAVQLRQLDDEVEDAATGFLKPNQVLQEYYVVLL